MHTARVAAQLARESRVPHIATIAEDALWLVQHARTVRTRVEAGKGAAAVVAKCRLLLAKYGAELVEQNDAAGMVLGARFQSGTYRNGFSDVFHIV